jgi:hypothetical protein
MTAANHPAILFEADSVDFEGNRIENVRLALQASGGLLIEGKQVSPAGLELVLPEVEFEGTISEFSSEDGTLFVQGQVRTGGLSASLRARNGATGFLLELKSEGLSLTELNNLDGIPGEFDWIERGRLDAGIQIGMQPQQAAELTFQATVSDLAFDSPEGRFAGDALQLDASGSWRVSDGEALEISGELQKGELLLDDFYRNFSDGALEFQLQPQWSESLLEIGFFQLTDRQSLTIEGRAEWALRNSEKPWVLEINRLEMDFPGAYRHYIEPAAATWTLDGMEVTGRVTWNGQWYGGEFRSGDLNISDLTIVDAGRDRFAVTGLEARLRPGDHSFASRLGWRGLLLGQINLGEGRAVMDSEPGAIALAEPLLLDVLGGRLNFGEFRLALPDQSGEWDVRMKVALDELDIEQLTAALGWPAFRGRVSGDIPGVEFENGVLEVDGEILVSVFDGVIALRDLRVERPFGVLPSLAASVEVNDLALDMLTSTFSFGQIAGRLDGYVNDLRMLDWSPVAFDAWFGTPERQSGKNNISRQAVNHLTTIGGGKATAALTSPLLSVFNNFSYRRLGLGCKLHNNVCEVRGLDEEDSSVLIMEGAGIPKVTIRAFNRHVDWAQMVANLMAISGEDSVTIEKN